MNRLVLLLFLSSAACAGTLTRIPAAQPDDALPKIDRLTDLGALPIPDGPVDLTEHDERFTPSEWVAIVGEGLHKAELSLDDHPIEIGGYLSGGSVLIRLPSNLPPQKHRLVAKSSAGQTETAFDSMTYVVGSDTDGNAIRFLRLGAREGEKVDDPDLSLEQKGTLYHAYSPDGAILYGLGLTEKKPNGEAIAYATELTMVHLGAGGKPRWLGSITFSMNSHPSGVAVTPEGILLVLGTHELLVFSVAQDPKTPQPIGKLILSTDPVDRFLDMALLQNGRSVALLEANDNRVVVISLADPASTKTIAQVELGPALDTPFSVDVVSDPTDPDSFYVLQGLNLRLGGNKIEEGKSAVTGIVKAAYDLVAGKPQEKKEAAPKVDLPARGKLIGFQLSDRGLEKSKELPLPDDFIPLFCAPAADGRFFVSGVAPGALETSSLDPSIDSAGRLLRFVKDSVQLGKIVTVDRSGASTIAVQGVAVFFDVAVLPNDELVYSGMRITGKALPPFLAVKWGVGVGSSGFYGLHELEYDYVIPPYTYGQVSVQHGTH